MADQGKHAEQSHGLRCDMSVAEFDAGYFHAADLKAFVRELGITVGNFRKIELEELIREFLSTGRIPERKPVMPRKAGGVRDALSRDTVITNYVGDKTTKTFLLQLVHAKAPGLKDKSGQWYWLNDWRRKQQERQARFTYQDLADHLRSLMETKGHLPQIPSVRMNNFITDFRADPANRGVSRDHMMQAWMWLKSQPGPNTYAEYRQLKPAQPPSS